MSEMAFREMLREAHFAVPQLRRLEKQASGLKIGVLGDFYLDRYIVGKMEAISREAPVPIVRIVQDRYSPGAAGNIAANLRSLGCSVLVFGPVGKDLYGQILRQQFQARGIDTRFLKECANWKTPHFNKVYASVHGSDLQQVARFDQEPGRLEEQEVHRLFGTSLREFIRPLDALVIADYTEAAGNGWLTFDFVQSAIRIAREEETRIFGTSRKRSPWLKGCHGVVLNEVELMGLTAFLEQTVGDTGASLEENLQRAASFLTSDVLFLTLGERGIFVAERGQPFFQVPTCPLRSGIDVTGAGDTALAALVVGTLSGMQTREAALLANLCAGVVIRKVATTGTATVEEVIAQIRQWRQVSSANR